MSYSIEIQDYIYKIQNTNLSGSVAIITFDEILVTNRQYDVTITSGISGNISGYSYTMENDYSFWFTSRYCPIFSTINRVKLQGGPLLDSFNEDTIYRSLHKNSLDAVELYNISNANAIAYDYWGCTWHNAPIHIKRYVECKTAYDLLSIMRITSQMGGGTGDQLKTLGDMTIKYGAAGGNPSIDPKRLSDLYACWNESLRMFRNISVTVKAYFDTSMMRGHPARSPLQNRVIRPVSPRIGFGTPGTPYYRNV